MRFDQWLKLTREARELKKIYDYVMSAKCNVIVFLPVYGQFAAIRKPDSGRIVYKTYIFINSDLSSYKNWKQN